MPGSGGLTITGQLGDVMKESAQAALSYVRGHWQDIAPELDEDWFAKHDIHIHVPAGAVPKDGPSAGVAMTVALSSLISGRPVRNDVAMTGEVTLTGQVLPIGGLKEKSLAAQRAGIKRVIVPERNEGDVAEIPEHERSELGVRLRRRGLRRRSTRRWPSHGGCRGAGRAVPSTSRGIRDAGGARSGVFWIVAGLTALAAALRFATLGVQAYHHDEIVTASRVLRGDFWHAMDAVGFSESAPPLYYALAWLWTQLTGTGEFGLRSLSAARRRGHGPCRLPARRRAARPPRRIAAAALVAVNPMLLWYSQEARGYALLVLLQASRALLRARAGRRAPARLQWWGISSGLALATHYFAFFPIAVRGALAAVARGAAALAGSGSSRSSAWRWRRSPTTRCPTAMPNGSASTLSGTGSGRRSSTFFVGETGDIIARPSARCSRSCRLLWRGRARLLVPRRRPRGARGGRRCWCSPRRPRDPVGDRGGRAEKDFVLARNLIPALVPLLAAVAVGVTLAGARRLGVVLAAALVAYSLAFSILASVSPGLQRPDWDAVAEHIGDPTAPRRSSPGPSARPRCAATSRRLLPGPSLRRLRVAASHEVDFVSDGPAPPPPAAARRRASARWATNASAASISGATRARPRSGPPATPRGRAKPSSTSVPTASCSTGGGARIGSWRPR